MSDDSLGVPRLEFVPRCIEDFDPGEPLLISHGDAIAARNVVVALLGVLGDPGNPPSDFQAELVRTVIRYGVLPGDQATHFETLDDAVSWLTDLRDNLGRLLPALPPGEQIT